MNLWMLLEETARRAPSAPAVVDGSIRLSYGELRQRAAALACAMAERGVSRGDRVAMLGVNSYRALELYFACAALGAVLAPLNYRLAPPEIGFILQDSGACGAVVDAEFAPLLREALGADSALGWIFWSAPVASSSADALEGRAARQELSYDQALEAGSALELVPTVVPADAPAHLYYTSGTTGRAKGVILTHRNVGYHAAGTIEELELSSRDVWAHVAPMFHLADAWATFAITQVGGKHAIVPKFTVEGVFDLMEREGVTITNLVPTMLNLLVKSPSAAGRRFPALRRILSGGAPIAPEVVRAIVEVFGCEYVQTYGLTETSPYLTFSLLDESQKLRSPEEQFRLSARTGRPARFVSVRVVDESGRDVPRDDQSVGEVIASGPTVTPGYWNRPEETRAALRNGWFHTGDLAVVDGDGFIQIVDRKKDMINSGGEKVYSVEVESALYSHPAVLEAAVFAMPDAVWGERVAAAVVLRAGARAHDRELIEHCRARLAHYKAPREVHFVEELPKTGTGKIAKRLLRDRFAGGA